MIFSIFFIEKHMRFIHNVQTGGMFFHIPVCSGIPYSPWYLPAVQNQVNGFLFILGCFTTILSVTVCHKKLVVYFHSPAFLLYYCQICLSTQHNYPTYNYIFIKRYFPESVSFHPESGMLPAIPPAHLLSTSITLKNE